MLIGEFLPKVFINKLQILPTQEDLDEYNVAVSGIIREKLDGQLNGHWFTDAILARHLEVEIVSFNKRDELLNYISNDGYSRMTKDNLSVFQAINYKAQQVGVLPQLSINNAFSYDSFRDENGEQIIEVKVEHIIGPFSGENLFIGMAVTLNKNSLAAEFNVPPEDIQLDGFVVKQGEIIMEDGLVATSALAFYTQGGEPWEGEVHAIQRAGEEVFRSGREETSESVDLIVEEIPNFKVVDLRPITKNEISSTIRVSSEIVSSITERINQFLRSEQITSEQDYVSDALMAYGSDRVNNFIFSFDAFNMIKDKSALSFILKNIEETEVATIFESIKINKIRIVRERVVPYITYNDLGSPVLYDGIFDKDESPYVVVNASSNESGQIEEDSEWGFVEEVNIYDGDEIKKNRHFSVQDKGSDELTDGIYRYRIKIELVDPIVKYLENELDSVEQSMFFLKQYKEVLTLPKNYNYNTDRATTLFLDEYENQRFRNKINETISIFVLTRDLLDVSPRFDIDNDQKLENNITLATKLKNFLDPELVTIDNISIVIEAFEELASLIRVYVDKPLLNSSYGNNSDSKRLPRVLMTESTFDSVFDTSFNKKTGKNILG